MPITVLQQNFCYNSIHLKSYLQKKSKGFIRPPKGPMLQRSFKNTPLRMLSSPPWPKPGCCPIQFASSRKRKAWRSHIMALWERPGYGTHPLCLHSTFHFRQLSPMATPEHNGGWETQILYFSGVGWKKFSTTFFGALVWCEN